MKKMELGQVIDFCIAWSDRQEQARKQEKEAEREQNGRRKATQADIDAFFG